MQLTSKFKIKEAKDIVKFLNDNRVGRISTIDSDGFPQIIPMNFVFTNNFTNKDDKTLDSQKGKNKEIWEKDIENFNNNDCYHVIYMHSHKRGKNRQSEKKSKGGF
jgi:hypothetical protein